MAENGKRRPGRPRKITNSTVNVVNHGIMQIPLDDNNICEFIYYQPQTLKKILTLSKNMENPQLFIKFAKDKLYFKTRCGRDTTNKIDTSGSHNIVTFDVINGAHYYCGIEYELCVNIENLFSIFSRYDKEEIEIKFYLMKNDYRSTLYIDIKTYNPNKTKKASINIITGNEEDREFLNLPQNDKYDLVFELPLKEFKKEIAEDVRINQIGKSGTINVIEFEKVGENPLVVHHGKNDQIDLKDFYEDDVPIINNKMKTDDVIWVKLETYYLKLFCSISNSSSTKNEKIEFSISNDPKQFVKVKVIIDKLIYAELYNNIYIEEK
jgi:hypothetical protein